MERKNTRRRWAIGLGLLVLAAASAHAQTNPYQKGPDPTSASLNATSGSFSVATSSVSSLVSGFGGGTIYYPTTTGTYAVLAISPGFTATQSSIAWLGRRIATNGFVVITIDTNSTLDQPPSCATQLMAALNYVTNSSSATVRAKVDASRRGVAGHSMGGGGTLYAARDNPSLKAARAVDRMEHTQVLLERAGADAGCRRGVRLGRIGLVTFHSVLQQPVEHARQGLCGTERRFALRAQQHQHADWPLLGGVGEALHGQRHALYAVPVRRSPHELRYVTGVLGLSVDLPLLSRSRQMAAAMAAIFSEARRDGMRNRMIAMVCLIVALGAAILWWLRLDVSQPVETRARDEQPSSDRANCQCGR